MNCCRTNDRTKSVRVVKSRSLLEALGNKTCLVSFNLTSGFVFDAENPLTFNDVRSIMRLDKRSSSHSSE